MKNFKINTGTLYHLNYCSFILLVPTQMGHPNKRMCVNQVKTTICDFPVKDTSFAQHLTYIRVNY